MIVYLKSLCLLCQKKINYIYSYQCVFSTWYARKHKQAIDTRFNAAQWCINLSLLLNNLYRITRNLFTPWEVLKNKQSIQNKMFNQISDSSGLP